MKMGMVNPMPANAPAPPACARHVPAVQIMSERYPRRWQLGVESGEGAHQSCHQLHVKFAADAHRSMFTTGQKQTPLSGKMSLYIGVITTASLFKLVLNNRHELSQPEWFFQNGAI